MGVSVGGMGVSLGGIGVEAGVAVPKAEAQADNKTEKIKQAKNNRFITHSSYPYSGILSSEYR
jgi:hypothetical protein